MTEKQQKLLTYSLLITAMIIWAASFVWSKIALEYYSSFTIVFFRLIISSIFLLIFFLFYKRLFLLPDRRHLPIFLLLSFFEPFLYFIGETTGLSYVSPAVAAVIIAVIPLFTPFAALIFLRERISVLNLIGISISMCGIILVIFEKGMKLIVAWEGLALLFLAVFSAVAYSVIVKKLPKKYSVFNILLYQNVIGAFFFMPIVLIFFTENIISTGFQKDAFWAIMQLGFFASTLAFLFFLYALRRLSINNVNVFTNVIPIFTLIISWLLLKDIIMFHQIIGIIVVILGVAVSQFRRKSYQPKVESIN